VAPTIRKLAVPYFPQDLGYYCGPACVQMMVASAGKLVTQDELWSTIKAETNAARPKEAPETPGSFPSQQCDLCGTWHCWDTHPLALSKCVNTHAPWTLSVMTRYPQTMDETMLALIDSIDGVPGTPACTSFYAVNHWVVITGYHLDDLALPGAAPYQVGSLNVNGMYFHNPNTADPTATVSWLPTVEFRQVLGPISCGANLDRYPIVVASWWGSIWILIASARTRIWRSFIRIWRGGA
jgi:hypothetical protein